MTKQRNDIGEELVRERDTLTSTRAQSQGTGLASMVVTGTSVGAWWQRVHDEVGVENAGSVVGEALGQLTDGDGVSSPADVARHSAQGVHLLLGGHIVIQVTYAVGQGLFDVVVQSIAFDGDALLLGGGLLNITPNGFVCSKTLSGHLSLGDLCSVQVHGLRHGCSISRGRSVVGWTRVRGGSWEEGRLGRVKV
jgi:hypothetical protein